MNGKTIKMITRVAPALAGCDAVLALTACQTTADLNEDIKTTSIADAKSNAPRSTVDDRPYAELIEKYANENDVPLELAHAVVFSESTYRPDVRGAAGEIGLMQLRPSTARMMGFSGGSKELFQPETNISYGMKYLGKAHQLADGDTCGTILKYNAGHGATRMNPISQAYCNKVEKIIEKDG
ncbi:MAG: transglycosylase SLT domain-containing protein [Pseudomonadota bacterium]